MTTDVDQLRKMSSNDGFYFFFHNQCQNSICTVCKQIYHLAFLYAHKKIIVRSWLTFAFMAKKKFYVVWVGVEPGIYETWAACQAQIKGFPGAKYKSFPSREAALIAYADGYSNPASSATKNRSKSSPNPFSKDIIKASWSVDAACAGNPGIMEYQGVHTADGTRIFHQKFALGTNNIGEFLAIVHALALLKKLDDETMPIYTDSRIAAGWVARKKAKTTLVKNSKTRILHEMIARAEKWLQTNTYRNPIIKWETKKWGEIPADFGRK